jgi:KUP system potassium uptake protein
MTTTTAQKTSLTGFMIGAIGIVYGDIGTSPLYTLKEVFNGSHPIPVNTVNILGALSLIFWALTIVVSLKYVIFIMRADNHGEGGIMALLALALRTVKNRVKFQRFIGIIGIIGVALFYGDGMITPAISVLSAIEGLEVAEPALQPYIVPTTILVLAAFFLIQYKGTGKVGALFGPIMITWFIVIAVLGLLQILQEPFVLRAINPLYAVYFFMENAWFGFLALGGVVLCLTGAEALYADMGHFGRKPITISWLSFVFPALILNYFGQGALLLSDNNAIQNPFYMLAPEWSVFPLVILSTVATIIASQAIVSGAFSMTQQAVRLGYLPRVEILHTSEETRGQIYVPSVNWFLFLAVTGLVLGFRTSDNLAAAYGLAVTGTMLVTTILAFVVIQNMWKWGLLRTLSIISIFLIVDTAFFSANLFKIPDGGWLPLLIGFILFVVMMTWKQGTTLLRVLQQEHPIPLSSFVDSLNTEPKPTRVHGTAVFLTANTSIVPRALMHNLMHNKVLHNKVILLNVLFESVPHIPSNERIELESQKNNFFTLNLHYGFKDELDVPAALAVCQGNKLHFILMDTSFFIGRATLVPALHSKLPRWQEKLFFMMYRNGISVSSFFKIPSNRVVELGTQIEV